jgi:hypothetical protein
MISDIIFSSLFLSLLLFVVLESIKEKLGRAALQQSQKILNEVLDTNLQGI